MVNWMERARAEISRCPVQSARDAPFGSIDSTPILDFFLFLAYSGPIFRKTPGQPTAITAKRASEHGILSWHRHVTEFEPQTTIGEKLRRASLAFLQSELALRAAELAWNELELFGIFDGADADVINRRPAEKGLVSFVALAPWPDTRIESFHANHAVIVTGHGGTFASPKRAASFSMAFWQSEAL